MSRLFNFTLSDSIGPGSEGHAEPCTPPPVLGQEAIKHDQSLALLCLGTKEEEEEEDQSHFTQS